jgi:RNA polymerase sigma factor (sigma-70 family)
MANVFRIKCPPGLRKAVGHAARLNDVLQRLWTETRHLELKERDSELRTSIRATVEECVGGRRDEAAAREAIVKHVRDLHRTVSQALGLGRRLDCCRDDDEDATWSTTAGLSLGLSIALGAATTDGGGPTERRELADGSEVPARFRGELGLVEREARALARTSRARVEDLRGYGYDGLLDAARRFDPGRGVPFARLARECIRACMLKGIGASGGAARDPVAVAVAHADATPPASPETVVGDAEELALLPVLLKGLPDAELRLLERLYVGGESLTQAGAALGVSPATACRMHGRALASLRRQLRPSDTI